MTFLMRSRRIGGFAAVLLALTQVPSEAQLAGSHALMAWGNNSGVANSGQWKISDDSGVDFPPDWHPAGTTSTPWGRS